MSTVIDHFIPNYISSTTWLQYQNVINTLPDDCQRDIYLLCPFVHVPIGFFYIKVTNTLLDHGLKCMCLITDNVKSQHQIQIV